MLSKLFRPKWQHENPQVRKTAIEKLSSEDVDTLEQLALNDADASVRQHAIQKIENLPSLERIIKNASSTTDIELAIKSWALQLTQSEKLSTLEIEQTIINCTNENLLSGIIAHCESDNLRELALSGVTSEEQLLSLMNHTKNGRVWQTIISKLQSEDALKTAQSLVKGRDKKSLQLIKSKLDEIKLIKTSFQAKEAQAKKLLEKLEGLLKAEYNPLFEGVLLTAKKQWNELSGDFQSSYANKISDALTQCENQLKESQQEKNDTQQAAEQLTIDSGARKTLLEQVNTLKEDALSQTFSAELLQSKIDALNKEWVVIEHPPQAADQTSFNQSKKIILKTIEATRLLTEEKLFAELSKNKIKELNFNSLEKATRQLRKALKDLQWPDSEIKPEPIKAIENHLQLVLDRQKQLIEQTKNISSDITNWLTEIDLLIEKNELANAVKLQKKIRSALTQLPENESKQFSANFQRINQAIHALEDWKDYATDPKREALSEEMKKLISAEIPPENKAENIKKIQQEWKSLGPCHNQGLWQQFKDYADEAYIPCQKYFDEQKQLREFNAQQRTTICEQLEAFIEQQTWEDCDWKAIEKLHRAIQNEWKKFSPVERQTHKPLQDRYFNSLNKLKEKLNEERQKNGNTLKNLVEQAAQLKNIDTVQDAIDQYQKIHEQWKSVGITFRKEQQEQWQALKTAGDVIYETRQDQRKEVDNERQQTINNANQLCDNIIKLSQLDDSELSNSRTNFKEFCDSFRELDALPKGCMQTFQKVCTNYEDAIKNIGTRLWIKQLEALEQIANEWGQDDPTGQTSLFDSVSSDIPEKWQQRLKNRHTAPISDNAEKNARSLCIDLEILCDAETPDEDASLKMAMQMEKLTAKFGSQSTNTFEKSIEELYLCWFSQPCWNKESYKILTERFLSTAKKSLPARR